MIIKLSGNNKLHTAKVGAKLRSQSPRVRMYCTRTLRVSLPV